ncbi:MAG: rhomboid family intramembrane serine protease [Bacteroidia bacterium]
MKIHYNSPVILTYALICAVVLFLDRTIFGETLILSAFSIGGDMSLTNPLTYFRMFSHTIGHGDWNHLLGNFSIILLIGPILEEKYGSRDTLFMMLVTAFITAVLQLTLFSEGLLGASGIAFMLILLSSFTNVSHGKIPLTFILVAVLFIGREVAESIKADNISQFAHIIGGVCGAAFGYWSGGLQKKGTTRV